MKCNDCVHHEILISIQNRLDKSNIDDLNGSETDNITAIKVTLDQLRRTDPYKEFKRKDNLASRRTAIVSFEEKKSKSIVNLGRRHGVPDTQFKLDLGALKEMADKRQESVNIKVRRLTHKGTSRSYLKDLFVSI